MAKKITKKTAKTKKSVIKKSSPSRKNRSAKSADRKKEFEARTLKLLNKGRERGFVTYDEILKEFPNIETDVSSLDELYSEGSRYDRCPLPLPCCGVGLKNGQDDG